jgi:hypothetical protein
MAIQMTKVHMPLGMSLRDYNTSWVLVVPKSHGALKSAKMPPKTRVGAGPPEEKATEKTMQPRGQKGQK